MKHLLAPQEYSQFRFIIGKSIYKKRTCEYSCAAFESYYWSCILATFFLLQIDSSLICEGCTEELQIVFTFRKKCLYSQDLMEEISSNISDSHRILIEDKLIDVGLFESVEQSYVYPMNVASKLFDKTIDVLSPIQDQNMDKQTDMFRDEVEQEVDEEIFIQRRDIEVEDILYEPVIPGATNQDEPFLGIIEEGSIPEPINENVNFDIIEETDTTLQVIQDQGLINDIEMSQETETTSIPKEKKHKCNKCKISYMRLATLNMHKWKRHKIPISVETKKKISRVDTLGDKDIYYGVDLTITCEYCFNEFINSDGLKQHLEIMHQEIPRSYSCKICTKLFKSKENLRTHFLAIHTDERREYQCRYCEKVNSLTICMKKLYKYVLIFFRHSFIRDRYKVMKKYNI